VADAIPILVEANLWLQTSELAGMPVVQIRCDSMEPALRSADYVLLDTDDTDVSPGGIFALLDENGSLIIKQVEIVRQSNGGQRISCMSRNSAYSPFELKISWFRKSPVRPGCRRFALASDRGESKLLFPSKEQTNRCG
jgi:hypothetical protein